MKKLLMTILLFISILGFSETLQTLDFELAGGYTTNITEFLTSVDDYYTRLDYTNNSSSISVEAAYTNFQGNYIFCMEDIGGTTEIQTMTLSSADISGYISLQIKVLVAGQDKDGISNYETTKYVSFYVNIDGGGEVLIGSFRGNDDGYLHMDDNLDGSIGAGETTILTSVFTDYTFNISGTGSSIVITVKCLLSAGNEEAAFDNIRIEGTDASLPVELSSFSAEPVADVVLIKWTTESEVDNAGFILERKSDESAWQIIVSYETNADLQGQGNTSSRTEYQFTDKNIQSGETYTYRLSDVNAEGSVTFQDMITITLDELPEETELEPPFPNPFNPQTKISYQLAESGRVEIAVYDMLGRKVSTLFNAEQSAGSYNIHWLGEDDAGKQASTGPYILQLITGDVVKSQKLVLMR